MADELTIEGKAYISSKRASELSGYVQDYIGQLARASFIDARRIGGLWYVSLESLENYKKNAETIKTVAPQRIDRQENTETIVTLSGIEYVSASRASQLSRYNQDYIGQLARGGKILSMLIGNRWYVDRKALFSHKEEKDALLAAVQADSVGIHGPQTRLRESQNPAYAWDFELMEYKKDQESDLIPSIREVTPEEKVPEVERTPIPIRIHHISRPDIAAPKNFRDADAPRNFIMPKKPLFYVILSAGALVLVVILFVCSSLISNLDKQESKSLTASPGGLVGGIGMFLEALLARDLVYIRPQ